jgi:CarD family transcriptional regulator
MRTRTTFGIGDKVVYPMHGIGWVANILTQTMAGQPRRFYQIVLEARVHGDVLVPVDHARALGLRRPLQARQVQNVLQRLQQAASRQPKKGQNTSHYGWCKACIRQKGALGLAEVRRFLYDLEGRERLTDRRLRRLRTYVYTQLPTEIAHALHCSPTAAAHMVDVALTSQRPMPTLRSPVPEAWETTP